MTETIRTPTTEASRTPVTEAISKPVTEASRKPVTEPSRRPVTETIRTPVTETASTASGEPARAVIPVEQPEQAAPARIDPLPAAPPVGPTIVVRPGVEFETAPASATAAPAPAASAPAASAPAVATRPTDDASVVAPRATLVRAPDEALSILMVASEAMPFAKTGGLADVAGALPLALGRIGHDVTLVIPRYRGVEVADAPLLTRVIQLGDERHTISVYEQSLGAHARVWLVDEPALFDREGLYGAEGHDHPDNPRRYALLARAALEAARAAGLEPDVVHAHDWQGGLVPVYLKTRFAHDPVLGGVPSVFTIHNVAYQGAFDPSWLPALDLGWDLFRPEALEYWHRISFLKAGIVFSEKVTTVSPRYAQEILTPEFAFGFEGVIGSRRADLVGILNGIDTDTWDPASDPHIPRPYRLDDLSGKVDAKRALLQAFNLPSDEAALRMPLIGQVSRMVDQKGLDLIAQIAGELPHTGARIVVLGMGEPRYEEMWRTLARAFPDRVGAEIGFVDERLAHLIEAGSDLFLMPSRFEPCGLNQMYSMRYGTLPLVRATGGLDDTVENYDPYTGRGNGFKFWEASGPALLNTLRWALRVYEHPEVWGRLQRAAMRADFSWDRSARDYAALYAQIVRARA